MYQRLTAKQREVMAALADSPGPSIRDVCEATGLSTPVVASRLQRLERHGLVGRIGYGLYVRTEAGRQALDRSVYKLG